MENVYHQDVCHLLHISLEGLPGGTASCGELSRILSLELQWFTPEEADEIVVALVKGGWMTESEGRLSPSLGLKLSRPPLGWRPTPRSLLELPEYQWAQPARPALVPEVQRVVDEPKPLPRISDPTPSNLPLDRADGSIPQLIGMIADKSALENKEVMRRAQRKRRALGPVTLWMALALVAREQGLDMHDVTAAIEA
jgi:hypothetical protein